MGDRRFVTWWCLALFGACRRDVPDAPPAPSDAAVVPSEAGPVSSEAAVDPSRCHLSRLTVGMGGRARTMEFVRDQGRIQQLSMSGATMRAPATFHYDDEGRLAVIDHGAVKEKLVYDDRGLARIDTEGPIQPVVFERDDRGRIVTQTVLADGATRVRTVFTYEGDAPAPTTLTVFDAEGATQHTVALTYDDHPNPLTGMGLLANPAGVLLGMPVSLAPHNVLTETWTAHVRSEVRIHGAPLVVGQPVTAQRTYTYGAHGLPLTMATHDNVAQFTYNCGV